MRKLALFLLLALPVAAQQFQSSVSLIQTTLSTKLDNSSRFVYVASSTGISPGSSFTYSGQVIYVDRELMKVTAVSGNMLTVQRGYNGTPAVAHNSGSTVYAGNQDWFHTSDPSGTCANVTVPYVNVSNGNQWACVSNLWQLSSQASQSGTITASGNNVLTGAQNIFLPSTNTTCAVGQTPGAQICTFSDNSTFINVTSRNGLYSVALDSDADGMPDVSAPVGGALVGAGLEFCGNGCGTANEIFVFPQGTATSSTQFNGMTFQLASDVWNGSTSAYDIYGIQAIQGGGTNPQTALEFTAGSGSSGFHSAFFTYPVQIGTLSVYGDNARFNLKATSGNPSEVFYDHNNTAAYTVGEFGRMSVNNCQVGGASGTASPAACGASSTGIVAVPSSQTTYTVNTTAVDANSEIFLQQMSDNSGLSGSPACSATTANPIQSSRVAGTSFTFALTSVAAVTCFKYWIVN